MMMPRPTTCTSVLAVPRSMAISSENARETPEIMVVTASMPATPPEPASRRGPLPSPSPPLVSADFGLSANNIDELGAPRQGSPARTVIAPLHNRQGHPAHSLRHARPAQRRAGIHPQTPRQEPAAGFPLTRCALAGMTRMPPAIRPRNASSPGTCSEQMSARREGLRGDQAPHSCCNSRAVPDRPAQDFLPLRPAIAAFYAYVAGHRAIHLGAGAGLGPRGCVTARADLQPALATGAPPETTPQWSGMTDYCLRSKPRG